MAKKSKSKSPFHALKKQPLLVAVLSLVFLSSVSFFTYEQNNNGNEGFFAFVGGMLSGKNSAQISYETCTDKTLYTQIKSYINSPFGDTDTPRKTNLDDALKKGSNYYYTTEDAKKVFAQETDLINSVGSPTGKPITQKARDAALKALNDLYQAYKKDVKKTYDDVKKQQTHDTPDTLAYYYVGIESNLHNLEGTGAKDYCEKENYTDASSQFNEAKSNHDKFDTAWPDKYTAKIKEFTTEFENFKEKARSIRNHLADYGETVDTIAPKKEEKVEQGTEIKVGFRFLNTTVITIPPTSKSPKINSKEKLSENDIEFDLEVKDIGSRKDVFEELSPESTSIINVKRADGKDEKLIYFRVKFGTLGGKIVRVTLKNPSGDIITKAATPLITVVDPHTPGTTPAKSVSLSTATIDPANADFPGNHVTLMYTNNIGMDTYNAPICVNIFDAGVIITDANKKPITLCDQTKNKVDVFSVSNFFAGNKGVSPNEKITLCEETDSTNCSGEVALVNNLPAPKPLPLPLPTPKPIPVPTPTPTPTPVAPTVSCSPLNPNAAVYDGDSVVWKVFATAGTLGSYATTFNYGTANATPGNTWLHIGGVDSFLQTFSSVVTANTSGGTVAGASPKVNFYLNSNINTTVSCAPITLIPRVSVKIVKFYVAQNLVNVIYSKHSTGCLTVKDGAYTIGGGNISSNTPTSYFCQDGDDNSQTLQQAGQFPVSVGETVKFCDYSDLNKVICSDPVTVQ